MLEYIYKSIIAAVNSQEIADEVATMIRKAIYNTPVDGVLNPCLSGLGVAGADQVAQLVKEVALKHK